MTTTSRDCRICATWECSHCGWKRRSAYRLASHSCSMCGSTDGVLHPMRHHDPRRHSFDELERDGDLLRNPELRELFT